MADATAVPSALELRVLAGRLYAFAFARLVVILLAAGFILVVEARWEPLHDEMQRAYTTLIAAGVLNIVAMGLIRTRRALVAQAAAQLALDIVVITLLVWFTGIHRVFSYLYFASVIAAALILSGRAALATASASSTVLAVVSLLQWRKIELAPLPQPEDTIFRLPYLASFAISLHLVGLLAGFLVRQARGLKSLHEEILENMVGGVVAIDPTGTVTFANRHSHGMLDLDRGADVEGDHYMRVLPEKVALLVQDALAEGRERVTELVRDGADIEVSVTPLWEDSRRAIRGAIVLTHDITVHHQLHRMRALAERFQVLAELSASIAHEIRNPLASIRGAAQELATSPPDEEGGQALMRVLVRETDRLDRIISEFLEFAREQSMKRDRMSLAGLTEDVALLLEARLRENQRDGVQVVRDCPPDLYASLDPDRIKQVLLNLGLNALDAVGGRGHVVLRARADGASPSAPGDRGITLEVEDDGVGIPPEDQSRIFDPFFTTKLRGTGMGLAIAQRLVRSHGGEIMVDSAPGRGSKFRIWLPE